MAADKAATPKASTAASSVKQDGLQDYELKESSAAAPAEPAIYSQSQMAEALKKLEAIQAELDAERERNAQLVASESGRRSFSGDRPFVGEDGGWAFEVGPANTKEYDGLGVERVKACDESEAIRWYCNSHDWPLGSGIALDPMRIKINCRCIDPARKDSILLAQRLGVIRRKLDAGQALSPAENELLDQYEHRVHNFN